MKWLFVPAGIALLTLIPGCSPQTADWFRIYDARAELESLRTSNYAGSIAEEMEQAIGLLSRTEAALSKKQFDEVAQLSELTLLRISYARAVARKKLAEQDAEEAEAQLDALVAEVEKQRERLRQAEEQLSSLTPPPSSAGVTE